MSALVIILLPHYNNSRLRLVNQEILDAMPVYEHPSESEWNPPADLTDEQAKYETLPLPHDS